MTADFGGCGSGGIVRLAQKLVQVSKESPTCGIAKVIGTPVRPEWFTQKREHAPSAAMLSQSAQHSQHNPGEEVESQYDRTE